MGWFSNAVKDVGDFFEDVGDFFDDVGDFLSGEDDQKNTNSVVQESDGVIGDFEQGNIGDCWILAALLCIANTPEGAQIIRDSIIDNGDGTYTVVFAGDESGTEYLITQEDLTNYNGVSGDIDAKIIELAAAKYYAERGRDIGDGGWSGFLGLLVGDSRTYENFNLTNRSHTSAVDQEAFKAWLIEQLAEGDGITLWLATTGWLDENGNIFTLNSGGHALAIVGIDVENNTISYINPWDSSEIITQDLDEFVALQLELGWAVVDMEGVWEPHATIVALSENLTVSDALFILLKYLNEFGTDTDGLSSREELFNAAHNGLLPDSVRAAAWALYSITEAEALDFLQQYQDDIDLDSDSTFSNDELYTAAYNEDLPYDLRVVAWLIYTG